MNKHGRASWQCKLYKRILAVIRLNEVHTSDIGQGSWHSVHLVQLPRKNFHPIYKADDLAKQ